MAFFLPLDEATGRAIITQEFSKSRQRAESAFATAQSKFLARNRAVEERDMIVLACEEKTSRLREARLAKEAENRATEAVASKLALKA